MAHRFATAWLITVLTACGGGGSPPGAAPTAPPGPPPRTEFQRRQEAACDQLGPRLTRCAYDSAKRNLTEAQMKKEQVDAKVPDHTAQIVDECHKQQMSSRQLRVYEVCMREESECGPLISCLEYAKPQHAKPQPK